MYRVSQNTLGLGNPENIGLIMKLYIFVGAMIEYVFKKLIE